MIHVIPLINNKNIDDIYKLLVLFLSWFEGGKLYTTRDYVSICVSMSKRYLYYFVHIDIDSLTSSYSTEPLLNHAGTIIYY